MTSVQGLTSSYQLQAVGIKFAIVMTLSLTLGIIAVEKL